MTTPFLVALQTYVQEVAVGTTTPQQDATFMAAFQASVLDISATLTDPVPLDSGLTAYFPFEGDLNFTALTDTDEFGNVGTLHNMTAANQVPGKIGQALKTSGPSTPGGTLLSATVGEIVVFPSNSFLDHTTDSFSVNYWFNALSQAGQWWCSPIGKSTGIGAGWIFLIDNTSDLLSFSIFDSTNNTASVGAKTSSDDGSWHMATGVVDRVAKLIHLYVDGVSVGSASIASIGSISNLNLPVWFGARNYPGLACFFNGLLDDVRHYSRALSQADVSLLFEIGSAGEA